VNNVILYIGRRINEDVVKIRTGIMSDMVILLNNNHHNTVAAAELIDTLVDMMQQRIYVPTRDIIEILSEDEWLKRKPVPRPRF
jgi:hypothetical protein